MNNFDIAHVGEILARASMELDAKAYRAFLDFVNLNTQDVNMRPFYVLLNEEFPPNGPENGTPGFYADSTGAVNVFGSSEVSKPATINCEDFARDVNMPDNSFQAFIKKVTEPEPVEASPFVTFSYDSSGKPVEHRFQSFSEFIQALVGGKL